MDKTQATTLFTVTTSQPVVMTTRKKRVFTVKMAIACSKIPKRTDAFTLIGAA